MLFFKNIFFCACLCCCLLSSFKSKAQNPGDLDLTFGNGGKVITQIYPQSHSSIFTVSALQADGKILCATALQDTGTPRSMQVFRYFVDGSIDNTWGQNGIATTEIPNSHNLLKVFDIKQQVDGKVVVVGAADTIVNNTSWSVGFVARYSQNGTLDSSFGNNGLVRHYEELTTVIYLEMVLTNSQIIVFGYALGTIAPVQDLVIQAFNMADGSVDSVWGNNGIMRYSYGLAMGGYTASNLIRNNTTVFNGKVLLPFAGRVSRFILSTGELDSVTFANKGHLEPLYASDGGTGAGARAAYFDMGVQPNGKILMSGMGTSWSPYANVGVVERYLPEGELDTTFADRGVLSVDFRQGNIGNNAIRSLAVYPNGRFIVAATVEDTVNHEFLFAMKRFLDSGEIDSAFGINGTVITSRFSATDSVNALWNVMIQPDNKILLAGSSFGIDSNNVYSNSFILSRYYGGFEIINDIAKVSSAQFTVYPNPANDILSVTTTENGLLEIYDISGRLVNLKHINLYTFVDISSFNNGIYIVRFTGVSGDVSYKKVSKM